MLKKWWDYLLSKLPELLDMESKDVVLGKLVADVHRKSEGSRQEFVALFQVEPVHALDREGPMEKLAERIQGVRAVREEWLALRRLDRAALDAVLPSVSGFKVLSADDGSVIAFEGNGRLAALHAVFEPDDGIELEVEVYQFSEQEKMLRRARRVQRMNRVGPFGDKTPPHEVPPHEVPATS